MGSEESLGGSLDEELDLVTEELDFIRSSGEDVGRSKAMKLTEHPCVNDELRDQEFTELR